MNKKRFLIVIAAALSIVGVLNINIKTVSAAETSTVPATTIAETPVPTAGVTKAVSEIDFSAPAVEPAPEPVEPTYSINGYDGFDGRRENHALPPTETEFEITRRKQILISLVSSLDLSGVFEIIVPAVERSMSCWTTSAVTPSATHWAA